MRRLAAPGHLCRCSACGAQHLRPKPQLASYCAHCFELLWPASRAKYCGPACRRAARRYKSAAPPVPGPESLGFGG